MTGLPRAHDPGSHRQAQHGLHGGRWPGPLAGKLNINNRKITIIIIITILILYAYKVDIGNLAAGCSCSHPSRLAGGCLTLLISRQGHSSIFGLFWITTVTSLYSEYSCWQVGSWGGPAPALPSPTSLTAWTRSLLCSQ